MATTGFVLIIGCASNTLPPVEVNQEITAESSDQPMQRLVVLARSGQSIDDVVAVSNQYFGSGDTVAPLFAGIDDDELARVYLVVAPSVNPELGPWDAAYAFQSAGDFERVEPDRSDTLEPEFRRNSAPAACLLDGANPNPDLAWSLKKINVPAAWQLQPPGNGKQFGEGARVCHPDTGWTVHDDLDTLDLNSARNVMKNNSDARDPQNSGLLLQPGHGTATGSVIASDGGIATGGGTTGPGKITGVAPAATIVPIRTVNSVVQVFDSDVAKAVAYAVEAQCDVVSMSLGGRGFFGLRSAVRFATENGLILVAASGNCVGFVVAPALYDETIAVAATNDQDKPWKGSSRGRAITISAPGENVWNADKRSANNTPQDIKAGNGTSFATAEIAGAAALWIAFHGRDAIETAAGAGTISDLFVSILQGTARTPTEWDAKRFGPGILDTKALLEADLSVQNLTAPLAPSAPVQESVLLLAKLTDRDANEIEKALTVMLDDPDDFAAAVDRWAPELMDIAIRNPAAFQAALDSALLPPRDPTDDRPRVQARSAIDPLVSNSLRSVIQ